MDDPETLQRGILASARKHQRAGRAGASIHLHILAGEADRIVVGPIITEHGPADLPAHWGRP